MDQQFSEPGALLVGVKVCVSRYECRSKDLAEGLDWVGTHWNAPWGPIRVANLSYSTCFEDDGTSAMAQQLDALTALGITVTVAHGNASNCGLAPGTSCIVFSPGSSSSAITVSGTADRGTIDRRDDRFFGDRLQGPRRDLFAPSSPLCTKLAETPNILALKPDISAPAQEILGASHDTEYEFVSLSGTSMTTAHVAGAVALLLEQNASISPTQIKDRLKLAADPIDNGPVGEYPKLDNRWDPKYGSGMLNVWPALAMPSAPGSPSTPTALDIRFPHCVEAWKRGEPCENSDREPPWNNSQDLATATPPRAGVPNTLQATIENPGDEPAVVRVGFAVSDLAVGNHHFHPVGTRQVTLPPHTLQTVDQPWTPVSASHQSMQARIIYGFDRDFRNNLTQRSLALGTGEYRVRIENPYAEPAIAFLEPRSRRENWDCFANQQDLNLGGWRHRPPTIEVSFLAPVESAPGERERCDLFVYAGKQGDDSQARRLIGGVTLETYVPIPCQVAGVLQGPRGSPLSGFEIRFRPQRRPNGERQAVVTDSDGRFEARLMPEIQQVVRVTPRGGGAVDKTLRVDCRMPLRLELAGNDLRQLDGN